MTIQGDNWLSPTPVQNGLVGVKYACLNPSVLGDSTVYNVLRIDLSRNLPTLVPVITEELSSRIDETFGLEDECHVVKLNDLVRQVIGRVSARVILGIPLCG